MVSELVVFLKARLDDDERIARAAIEDDGGEDGGFEDARWLTDRNERPWMRPKFGEAAGDPIRTFAVPRRVLAEVEAKRRIVAEYEYAVQQRDRHVPNTSSYRYWDNRAFGLYCALLSHAAVHADHADYSPEWRQRQTHAGVAAFMKSDGHREERQP